MRSSTDSRGLAPAAAVSWNDVCGARQAAARGRTARSAAQNWIAATPMSGSTWLAGGGVTENRIPKSLNV